jgi:glucose/arabinose dehydrogenase
MIGRRLILAALTVLLHSSGSGAIAPPDQSVLATPAVAVEPLPPGARIELVRNDAREPAAMAFAPDGRWFYTERTRGWVRMVTGSTEFPLFYAPANGNVDNERGLLGITLDPNFASNGYVYIYYTSAEDLLTTGKYDNRVVRFTLQGSTVISPTVMQVVPLDSNQSTIHNGGNLHFGPDGKLYVSIGDYFNAANGQNLNSMPGKIHRFNPTAPLSAPSDNPFYDGGGPHADSIYAYGFRNPFDFDFDPASGAIFAGENGVGCDDEVNRALPGYNYGWRANYPECDDFSAYGPDPAYNTIPPLIAWPYSAVPTGVTFYRGDLFPEWKNDLFVCLWKDGSLHHFKLNGARAAIASDTIVAGVVCHLDVETGNGGALYYFRNDETDPNKEYRDIYRITRDATVYASTFAPSAPTPDAGDALTYTLRLVHYGALTTTFAITSNAPLSTTLIGGSSQASGGAIVESGAGVTWTGSILPNTTLTATYRVTVSDQIVAPRLLSNSMVISTNLAGLTQLPAIVIVNGQSVYLPVTLRSFAP